MMKKGQVFLVGAGPGDVGLITVKGMEAIKKAEVILYDRLANPKLLEFAPVNCELIYCGKLPHRHTLRQEGINDLLVVKALEGKIIVRLKGGDPGVFGRVGEEAAALAEDNISFEIIPGISSGMAAPLYAGIPVTHREHAESFAVVTAHDKSKDGKPILDWEGLVRGVDTIAFYMGVANLPFICENLIKHGKSATTPVILIQWGTFGRQKTLEGTLETISDLVAAKKFSNPSIILVGTVISLREKLSWFEKKPLYGRQILLARTGTNESEVARELTAQGADVIEFPKWKKTDVPVDFEILNNIEVYEKMLFTSFESVADFFKVIAEQGLDVRQLKAAFYGLSIKSLQALKDRGFKAELAEVMPGDGRLLIIGDNHVRKNSLYYNFHYGKFDMWTTSDKKIDEQFIPIFLRMVEEADLNTLIFPSSASVAPFLEGIEACGFNYHQMLDKLQIICMGKKTWNEAEGFNLRLKLMPQEPTKKALLECLQVNPIIV
jgi:uroporphyrinogen III methyltransferase / synthase